MTDATLTVTSPGNSMAKPALQWGSHRFRYSGLVRPGYCDTPLHKGQKDPGDHPGTALVVRWEKGDHCATRRSIDAVGAAKEMPVQA